MKNNKILIGILVVAALLLALLYSPWGIPNVDRSNSYYGIKNGVNFSHRISNAPTRTSNQNEFSEDLLTNVEPIRSSHTGSNYSGGSISGYTQSSTNASYTVNAVSTKNAFAKGGGYGGGNSGMGQSYSSSGNSRHASSQSNSVPQFNASFNTHKSDTVSVASTSNQNASNNAEAKPLGFYALTTNLIALNAQGPSIQRAPGDPGDPGYSGDPGSDPGGEPDGNPIPVGDGVAFLMILAAIYIGLKTLHNQPKKTIEI
jgi:hypothetical protein